ncbi:MAG: serine/threonine protein kinase [Bacteroidales bacterium]|nr:serine/threonine protein kinase [Bacteroidales bacterium]
MPESKLTAATAEQYEPRMVAGYRILRRIARGGMAAVYLGYDTQTFSPVAVKVLAAHLSTSAHHVSRFHREASMSRHLSHPHLVRGLRAGYDESIAAHFLTMEYIDGCTAKAVMDHAGTMPIGLAVRITLDVCQALRYLHHHQYIHRDVKPDNMLIGRNGVTKLGDLGLAKRLSDDSHLTSMNQGVGTPHYMSHEQLANAALVDGRSDIFSVGASLFHMLAGRPPFLGTSHREMIEERTGHVPPSVARFRPDVPERLHQIVSRCLEWHVRERYQTVVELIRSLESTGLAGDAGGENTVDFAAEDTDPENPTQLAVASTGQ